MRFILIPGVLEGFTNIRAEYETLRKIKLDETPSMLGMPTMFGGTDVKNRRKQISFLEKMKLLLDKFLHDENEFRSDLDKFSTNMEKINNLVIDSSDKLKSLLEAKWRANLMASRILIAAVLFIQDQIGSSKENSVLYCLANKHLGVTNENYLDDEDKEICYRTAAELVNSIDAFTHVNNELSVVAEKSFTKEEWDLFVSFIKKQELKRTTTKPVENNYPVTTFIQPVFETAFSYVGSTIGWVVAEAVSNSSVAITPRLQVTSLVSTAVIGIGTAGPAGVALLAPTIAAKLINSFCTISLASITGTAMGYVGKGTGVLVGLPFDLVYNLLFAAGSLIAKYATGTPNPSTIDGIRIADGVLVIKNNPIQFKLIPGHMLPDMKGKRLQITENGEIYMDDKPIGSPEEKITLVIQELNDKLSSDADGEIEKINVSKHDDETSIDAYENFGITL